MGMMDTTQRETREKGKERRSMGSVRKARARVRAGRRLVGGETGRVSTEGAERGQWKRWTDARGLVTGRGRRIWRVARGESGAVCSREERVRPRYT